MDELEKLLARQKRIAKKVTGQVAQKAKEGLAAAKNGIRAMELPGKQDDRPVSLTPTLVKDQRELRGLQIRQLELQHIVRRNQGKLIAFKQLETVNEYGRKLDEAVYRAWFKTGGIRFHAETLLEHTALLDPAQDDVKTMVVRCYNSAIAYMRRGYDEMKAECDGWSAKLETVKNMYLDSVSLYKALGYEVIEPRLRELQKASSAEVAAALPELRRIAEKNEDAISGYLSRCEKELVAYSLQNMELLEAMTRLLQDSVTESLSTTEGWTPETYEKAISRYALWVREELLDAFPPEGEHDPTPDRRALL